MAPKAPLGEGKAPRRPELQTEAEQVTDLDRRLEIAIPPGRASARR